MAQSWVMLPCDQVDINGIACHYRFGRMAKLTQHKLEVHQIGVKRRVLTREEIDEAVKCPNWQELRIMLKGLPTTRKLLYCLDYLTGERQNMYACSDCKGEARYIQVLNYLNALSRGGRIVPLTDLITMDLIKYWDRIEVKK